MTKETLNEIQDHLTPFVDVIRSMEDLFPNNKVYTTLNVIVHNICLKATTCINYSHDDKVEELNLSITALKELEKYFKDDHIIQWITKEVLLVIGAHQFLENESHDISDTDKSTKNQTYPFDLD